MYSVVLMMALTGGAEAPEFGGRCGGCSGCHGCNGCSGGCHGCRGGKHSRCHGCSGCNGGCHGCHGGRKHGRCHGCNGCSGYSSCCGSVSYGCNGGCAGGCGGGTVVTPVTPSGAPKKMPAQAAIDNKARIVVTLPADARLSVDGTVTSSTSERRVLLTPVLEQGDYTYTLQAEIVRDGETVSQSRTVTVRANETTEMSFDFATQSVASR